MKRHSHTLAALALLLLGVCFCVTPQVALALDIPRPVQQMKRAKEQKKQNPADVPSRTSSTKTALSREATSRENSRQTARRPVYTDFDTAQGRTSNSGIPHWAYVASAIVIGLIIVGRFPIAIFAVAPILVIILIYIAIRHFF